MDLEITPEMYMIPEKDKYILSLANSTTKDSTDWFIGQDILRGRRVVFDNDHSRVGFEVHQEPLEDIYVEVKESEQVIQSDLSAIIGIGSILVLVGIIGIKKRTT